LGLSDQRIKLCTSIVVINYIIYLSQSNNDFSKQALMIPTFLLLAIDGLFQNSECLSMFELRRKQHDIKNDKLDNQVICNFLPKIKRSQRRIYNITVYHELNKIKEKKSPQVKWSIEMASIYEYISLQDALTLLLHVAQKRKNDVDETTNLGRMCSIFSSMLEAMHGKSLSIFLHEEVNCVHMYAQKKVLRRIFFLIFRHICSECIQPLITIECKIESNYLFIIFKRVTHMEDDLTFLDGYKGNDFKKNGPNGTRSSFIRLANKVADMLLPEVTLIANESEYNHGLRTDTFLLKIPERMCFITKLSGYSLPVSFDSVNAFLTGAPPSITAGKYLSKAPRSLSV